MIYIKALLDSNGLTIKDDDFKVVISTNKITIDKKGDNVVYFEKLYGMPFVSYDVGVTYSPLFNTWSDVNKLVCEYIANHID